MNDRSIKVDDGKRSKKFSKKKKISIIFVTVILLFGLIFLCGHLIGEKTGLKLSVSDIFNPIKANPSLEKDSSGIYTNILIVGIDARNLNSGLRNTDTIILLSYNHDEHYAVMTSIPRDFFVKVPNQNWQTKINGVYANGGIEALKEVVTEVTEREIQYYGLVNLAGFRELIDTIGGIEVDVENTFVDYQYPVEGEEHKYQTISFDAGKQSMDGEAALRFVRSRMSSTAGEGSDFARARRQQRVIVGLKEKIFSTDTLLSPKKIINVLNVLDKNIDYSDFTNEEMQAAIKIFQKENMETYSFVLDPSIANYKLVTDRGVANGLYAIAPTKGLGNYEDIHKYLENAYKKPLLYSEDPTILIYDIGLGNSATKEKSESLQKEFPFVQIQYMGTLLSDINEDYLYKTSEDDHDLDKEIEKYFSITMTEKPEFVKSNTTNGDYIILLGAND